MDNTLPANEDRVILISGANRGIGRAIAQRLAREGYTLSLGARKPETLANVATDMDPERVLRHAYEARDRQSAKAWVDDTVTRFGRVDAIVNNAGVFHRFGVEDGDEALLDEMWEVNVKGPLRLFQAAFPHLAATGRGRVVNIVSLSGMRLKSATAGGYAMTKHAMMAFSHAVRYSGWENGVRATAVCPGYADTDMARQLAGFGRDELTPPEAIADVVAAILSLPNNASVALVPINCVLEHSV